MLCDERRSADSGVGLMEAVGVHCRKRGAAAEMGGLGAQRDSQLAGEEGERGGSPDLPFAQTRLPAQLCAAWARQGVGIGEVRVVHYGLPRASGIA